MNQIQPMLQKEMTRKEFMTTMGFALASIMGFSTLIRLLTGKSADHHLGRRLNAGYGSSAYGGVKDK